MAEAGLIARNNSEMEACLKRSWLEGLSLKRLFMRSRQSWTTMPPSVPPSYLQTRQAHAVSTAVGLLHARWPSQAVLDQAFNTLTLQCVDFEMLQDVLSVPILCRGMTVNDRSQSLLYEWAMCALRTRAEAKNCMVSQDHGGAAWKTRLHSGERG